MTLAAMVHGCSSAPDGASPSTSTETTVTAAAAQPLTRLLSVATSGFTEPAELVLRDRAALESAWRTLHDGLPGNPAPPLDLATRIAVLVALGPRNTGGYTVRVDSVTTDGSRATVHYTVTSPGPSCMTTQALTSPVDVVSVARIDGAVRFDRRDVVQQC
jgi:hypothetical protein